TVLAGQEAVRSMCGPVARSVADLAMFFRAMNPRRMSALDARVPPLAWDDPAAVSLDGLRVGFYSDDGVLAASRSIVRAIGRAGEALEAHGCSVTPFTPPDVPRVIGDYLA